MQLRRVVDTDRKQKRPALRHQVRTLIGKVPFEPEITLGACLGTAGNDRDEEHAGANFATDLLIPGVAALQLALIEPHFDASRPQAFRDSAGSFRILRRVAEKDGSLAVPRWRGFTQTRFVRQAYRLGGPIVEREWTMSPEHANGRSSPPTRWVSVAVLLAPARAVFCRSLGSSAAALRFPSHCLDDEVGTAGRISKQRGRPVSSRAQLCEPNGELKPLTRCRYVLRH